MWRILSLAIHSVHGAPANPRGVALCGLSLLSVLSSLLQEVLLQVLQFPLSLKELCQDVYPNSNCESCHQIEWNIKITDQNIERRYK